MLSSVALKTTLTEFQAVWYADSVRLGTRYRPKMFSAKRVQVITRREGLQDLCFVKCFSQSRLCCL